MKKIKLPKDKFILDACCGGRMFWFDKKHPAAVYMDIKEMLPGSIKQSPWFSCLPDVIVDFKNMPFEDNSFKLIVFDPPHLLDIEKNSWVYKKFGGLEPETWQSDLNKGFKECWRVLQDYGVLIVKWSVSARGKRKYDIPLEKMLAVLPEKPLFGHTTGRRMNTQWITFMKIP